METPPFVRRAARLAAAGPPFDDELGVLLHVLAGRRGVVRAAVVDRGDGIAAAWVAAALAPEVPLVVVIPAVAEAPATAAAAFAADPHVVVAEGPWPAVLARHAPFGILVHDASAGGGADPDEVAGLLTPGAAVVLHGPLGREACDAWTKAVGLAAVRVAVASGATAIVAGSP